MGGGASKAKTTDAQSADSTTTEAPAPVTGAIVVAAEDLTPPINNDDALLASCLSNDPLLSHDPLPSVPTDGQQQNEQQATGNEPNSTQDKPKEPDAPPEEEKDKPTTAEGEGKEHLAKPRRSIRSNRGADFSGSEDEYEVIDGEDGLGMSSRTATGELGSSGVLPFTNRIFCIETNPHTNPRPTCVHFFLESLTK
eukprot:1187657-Prorocentrum_minimum.AAC.4